MKLTGIDHTTNQWRNHTGHSMGLEPQQTWTTDPVLEDQLVICCVLHYVLLCRETSIRLPCGLSRQQWQSDTVRTWSVHCRAAHRNTVKFPVCLPACFWCLKHPCRHTESSTQQGPLQTDCDSLWWDIVTDSKVVIAICMNCIISPNNCQWSLHAVTMQM